MRLIVEHCGDSAGYLAQSVFLNDDEGYAGGSQVLLCAAVDEAVFRCVEHAAEDVGAHVANHRYGAFRSLAEFGAVDGVVRCIVEVIGIRGDNEILRYVVVVRCF